MFNHSYVVKKLHLFTCLNQICNERYIGDIVKRENELLISLSFTSEISPKSEIKFLKRK